MPVLYTGLSAFDLKVQRSQTRGLGVDARFSTSKLGSIMAIDSGNNHAVAALAYWVKSSLINLIETN
jgi:hypothetical protein